MSDIDLKRLRTPFPAKDVEWRIQSSGEKQGRPWARVLAYVTNRAIMDRLDDVCGPANWRDEYREWNAGGVGVLCGISIRVGDEWVTKWDGAEVTDIESVKGGLSASEKRAGVKWGIGRYLYDLEDGWAVFDDRGQHSVKIGDKWLKWNPPALPAWALPPLHEPPPADSRAANTLSPAEQDRARQANPQPAAATISRETFKNIEAAGKALRFRPFSDPSSEWFAIMGEYRINRLGELTVQQGQVVLTGLLRRRVDALLTKLAMNLDDVRVQVPAVTADVPSDLTLEEAGWALEALEQYEGVAA